MWRAETNLSVHDFDTGPVGEVRRSDHLAVFTRDDSGSDPRIREHIQAIYGVEVSVELISSITDVVTDEVRAWQSRRLDEVYPILYLDALRVKARTGAQVTTRAIYVVIGVNMAGKKAVFGFWACESEGAKFWLSVLTDLKNRGVRDILIACGDGLKGFPEAIQSVFPQTEVQLCIVHLIRSSAHPQLDPPSGVWRNEEMKE